MLNVLGHMKHAWPVQRGGSEVAAHRVLAWLAGRGHDVNVAVTRQRAIPTEGVNYVQAGRRVANELWSMADVVLTHQGASAEAIKLSEEFGTPVVHWAHNLTWFGVHKDILRPDRDIIAWNSQTLADREAGNWTGRSLVLHPPTFPDQYRKAVGDSVLQVNLNALKGADTFWSLAAANTDKPFLAVVGGWLEQIDAKGIPYHWNHSVIPLQQSAPKNVDVVGTTEDMAGEIYPQARVLIMPTGKVTNVQVGESWGLVAAEATCCGIPVIATRSPGTEELLGDAGILIDDPSDLTAWQAALDRCWDPTQYAVLREAAAVRRRELDPTDELIGLEKLLDEVAA